MKRTQDWKDFTIRWDGHQKYIEGKLYEDNLIEVIVQKIEMILFTKQGEVYGEDGDGLGANIEYYLWETKISNEIIKSKIVHQINKYIQELNIIGYELDIKILPGTFRDILEINVFVKGYNLFFIFN